MANYELVYFDDWEVLFKDGELYKEQHQIIYDLSDAIDFLAEHDMTRKNFKMREGTEEEYRLMEKYGTWRRIPEELKNA